MNTYNEGYQAMGAALAGVGHSEGEVAEMAVTIARVLGALDGANALNGAAFAIAERIEAEAALADRLCRVA